MTHIGPSLSGTMRVHFGDGVMLHVGRWLCVGRNDEVESAKRGSNSTLPLRILENRRTF